MEKDLRDPYFQRCLAQHSVKTVDSNPDIVDIPSIVVKSKFLNQTYGYVEKDLHIFVVTWDDVLQNSDHLQFVMQEQCSIIAVPGYFVSKTIEFVKQLQQLVDGKQQDIGMKGTLVEYIFS